MKLPTSLLQAILVGATLGTATLGSCSKQTTDDQEHLSNCPEGCTIDHSQETSGDNGHSNCPACGMG
jgi:hypothetical protein